MIRNSAVKSDSVAHELPLKQIISAVQGVRYGTVQIIVQDGVVVQIDKTEKICIKPV